MRLSSSTSGMWKRGMVWIVRHRQTKEPDTDRPNLNHRATSRLYKESGQAVAFTETTGNRMTSMHATTSTFA